MSKSNPFKNNNNNNKGNSRFSCLNEQQTPQIDNNIRKERVENKEPSINTRFDILKEDPLPISDNVRSDNVRSDNVRSDNVRRYSSFRSAPVVKKEVVNVIVPAFTASDFPDLKMTVSLKQPDKNDDESQNKWNNIVKKEVKIEVLEETEQKRIVNPGWVSIAKNKNTGKTEVIYGPLTEAQKQYEYIRYLEQHDLKYNMFKAVERMTTRWEEYRAQFDERNGQGAYKEKYGFAPDYYYNYDDDDDGDDDGDDSDYDYE